MRLYRTTTGAIVEHDGQTYLHQLDWDQVVNRSSLFRRLLEDLQQGLLKPSSLVGKKILAPIGRQELWAAGVTYIRSKVARMEESEQSGASRFYDLVYSADRPELFMKAAGWRVRASGEGLRIRKDSVWNVPEPELTLFICSGGTIEGYTIGNDMSSRSIEGENPLYLPQAKIFDGCASLGPCLLVPPHPINSSTEISISIFRDQKNVFSGSATVSQMKRGLTELAGWLTKELSFPDGVMLMTGTCIVPGDDFTLRSGDKISISITGIGSLENHIE
ncbi:MAG: fumarylacetoacetate hydrolase family protein [Bacteroidetes bacterium]|nr:fumarylacetoacetate hydrolase family protein [Bacteroidota bacterium]